MEKTNTNLDNLDLVALETAIKEIAFDPSYLTLLLRIVEVEEKAAAGKHEDSDIINKLGWQWYHVKAWPAQIMKLVNEGIVEITYKSRKHTHYRLVNREVVKKVLKNIFSGSQIEYPT